MENEKLIKLREQASGQFSRDQQKVEEALIEAAKYMSHWDYKSIDGLIEAAWDDETKQVLREIQLDYLEMCIASK